jgi:tetratricopeptide (TPR) repeat protein
MNGMDSKRRQPNGKRAVAPGSIPSTLSSGALLLCCLFAGCRSRGSMPSPSNVANPREAAEQATQAGEWGLAAERWYAVFLQDRDAVEPCAMTARALLHTKDADSASHILDIGLAEHPDDPDLCELKGDALVQLGFRRPAEAFYLRAIQHDEKRASALLSLALLRMDLGWEVAALKPLEQAIALTGGDRESWYMLAKARRSSGDVCGAFEAYDKAFAGSSCSVDDLVAASTLPINDTLLHAHPDAVRVMHGWLEGAVKREPQCTRAHFMLGVLAEDLGKRDEAIVHYRRAVETDPACLMSLRNLAVLYASMGDEKNTREIVTRALELEKDPDRRKALQRLLEPLDSKTAAESKRAQVP